jgi:hypothetical protein
MDQHCLPRRRAEKKRITADCHLDETIPVHVAQESVARAQEIIQALDAI